ncbi:MAG: flavin reductase family protein [Pseudomonadota bacterium]|nr:flavin reductase family protein [Pseudomonadota bacterium]
MPDSHSFRQLMGCFATGITVITTFNPAQEPVGITINSLTSVSLEPPLVLFCLEKRAHIFPIFEQAEYFAVNILAAQQEAVSRHFADSRQNETPAHQWDRPQREAPTLSDTLGWMICRKTAAYEGGDHIIFLGQVIDLNKNGTVTEPLVYLHGRYTKLTG